MRRLLVLVLAVGSACQRNRPTPTCEEMANHVQSMMTPVDEFSRAVRGVFLNRCTDDAWPEEVRSCIGATESLVEPRNCKQKLPEALAKKLDADLAEVQAREEKKVLPPVCAKYEAVVAKFVACDKVPRALRDDVAARLTSAKAEWASAVDKSQFAGACASATTLLRQAGVECSGADQW